jgi:phosphoglycerate dehydrogenase-like enzyme
MKIIILTTTTDDGKKLKDSIKLLNPDFSSVNNYTKEDILSNPNEFKDTSFIFSTWYMPIFSEKEISKYLPSLEAVFYAAGTVKYFAVPFFNEGVRIFSAAIANAIPVAEFVTAQILLANKGYFQAQKEYKKPFWRFSFSKARSFSYQKKGNYNAKIGVIGCGAIGAKVVNFLKSYHLDVLVYDPYLSDDRINELGVKQTKLKELFAKSDVISNHLPNITETKGLINWKLLSLMKENATFINTGRGEQVVEKDLAKFMSKNPKACALLDVTYKEPIRPWSKLLRTKNIFLTPHIAGSLSSENNRMVDYMLKAYFNIMKGNYDVCEVSIKDIQKQT